MAVLSTTRSIPQLQEALFGVGGSATLPVQHVYKAAVTVTTPSNSALGDGLTATATVTGVRPGDVVLASPTTALPTSQTFTGAYVTANDTVTFAFEAHAAVTGASRTFNVVVISFA